MSGGANVLVGANVQGGANVLVIANVLGGANVLGRTNVLVRANVLAGISNFQHSVDTIVQGLRQHEDSACRVP